MNKLTLLLLLALPACASGENAQLAQTALTHDQAVCAERGDRPGTSAYLGCMRNLGHRDGYLMVKAEDGQLAFKLPGEGGGLGAIGGGTFYPGVYMPPIYGNHN